MSTKCQLCFDDLMLPQRKEKNCSCEDCQAENKIRVNLNKKNEENVGKPLSVWTCYDCKYHLCENCFIKTCWDTHKNNMPCVPYCYGCGHQSDQSVVMEILGPNEFDKWQSIRTVCIIKYSNHFVGCPGIGCPSWYYSARFNTHAACRAECVTCDLIFCVACKLTWEDDWKDYDGQKEDPGKFHNKFCKGVNHIDDAVMLWMNTKVDIIVTEERIVIEGDNEEGDNEEEEDSEEGDNEEEPQEQPQEQPQVAKKLKIARKCVFCPAIIERTGGCLTMTCTECGKDMCWICGKSKMWCSCGRH